MKMLKKTLLCVLVFLAGLSISSVNSDNFISTTAMNYMKEYDKSRTILCDKGKCGDECTYTIDNKGVLVIGSSDTMDDFSVDKLPDWYKDYSGFIKEVVILDGVTNIGDYAFFGLSNLEKIYIPRTVNKISDSAFDTCKDFVIFASTNSYASKYAQDNNIDTERTIDMQIDSTNLKMFMDEEYKLNCSYKKEDLKEEEKLEWFSDREDIVKVDNEGKITPLDEGIANVYAKIGNISACCKVQIDKYNLGDAEIQIDDKDYVYDGEEKKPSVIIKRDGRELRKDSDYTIKYINNLQAGQASVVIEPGEYYSGKIEKSFLIKPAKVNFLTSKSTSTTSVYLDWEKQGEVDSYTISRSLQKDGNYEEVATSNDGNAVSYEDKKVEKGKKYYYKVVGNVCLDDQTLKSEESDIREVIPTIQAPKLNFVSNVSSKEINIRWDKVDNVKGYIVYRKDDNKDKSYKRIKEVSSDVLSFKDEDVKKDITYRYTVKAYDEQVEGEYDHDGILASLVDKVKLKSVKANQGNITFEWEKQDGVDGYYIFRKLKEGRIFDNLKTVGSDETKLVDESVASETDYTYSAAAYIRHGRCISLGPKDVKGLDEKSLIQPSYSIGMPSESMTSCYVVAMSFENTSKRDIRVFSENAAMSDKENEEFNRRLSLIDTKLYEKDKTLKEIEYVDIKPGEKTCLMFLVDGYASYYHSKTYVWFRFDYNNKKYVNKSSCDESVSYFEFDKSMIPEEKVEVKTEE